MEFSSSPPLKRPPRWRQPGLWTAAFALLAYALTLAHYGNACAGGSDSSGYLNNARLLAAGHAQAAPRTLPGLSPAAAPPYLYLPLGFRPGPSGAGMVPTYATGLPLLVVAAARLSGWSRACDLVMLVHALAGILLTYALGRLVRLPRPWAILAAAIVGASPLYVEYSLQAMSDLPATVWVLAAVVAAGRSLAGERRAATAWAMAAGFALALAVLIRPSNALAFAPVALALGASPRRWLALALGGLPGALFLFSYNAAAYGHFLATGYGDTRTLFTLGWVSVTLRHYLHWLPLLLTPVILPALLLPLMGRRAPRAAALLSVWVLAYLGFYCAYFNTHETWWYLRFVLPAAPALVVGGLLAVTWIFGRSDEVIERFAAGKGRTVFALALVLILLNGVWLNRRFQTLAVGHGEASYPLASAWAREHLPADSVLAVMQVSGAFFYYTDFTLVRWDQMEPGTFARVAAAAGASHRPIYAALFPFETAEALHERMPGRWTKITAIRDIGIWRHE